jgi:hypothetical protein
LIVRAVLSMAQTTGPGSMQSRKQTTTVKPTTVEPTTVKQMTLVSAIKAVSTGMR